METNYGDDMGTEDIKAKKELNAFLDQWLSNLLEQGHRIKADEEDEYGVRPGG